MNRIAIAVLAASLSLSAAGALASDHGRVDAQAEQRIREQLTAQGYDVRKIKMEDGGYEAYAIKDGKRREIYLNEKFEIIRDKVDD